MPRTASPAPRYRALNQHSIKKTPYWERLDPDLQEALNVVSQVLPFRTNEYVCENLIDWDRVPDDPIYKLTFMQRDMLEPDEYEEMRQLLARDAFPEEIQKAANAIRLNLNPHPAGQMTHNIPQLDGRPLPGLQHKYKETVLYFPGPGQTCHAYCTYCFRWPQFVDLPDMRFQSREAEDLLDYLKEHTEVTDVLVTGGDPLITSTKVLRRLLEPLLSEELEHVRHIRIGTKALAYWPQRFTTDPDADDLLRLFEEFSASKKRLAIMAHYSHPVEFEPKIARKAIRRLRDSGAQVRTQAPLVRHVNDSARVWAKLWRTAVRLGMIPYYMFVERDTGPRNYFEVPLSEAYEIFRSAYARVSGLARTVRGPSMSAFPGKVRVLGVTKIHGEKVFILEFLQARDPNWVKRPFFAKFDPDATWLDQLEPAFDEEEFFFEEAFTEAVGAIEED